jgi:hypothetical protein
MSTPAITDQHAKEVARSGRLDLSSRKAKLFPIKVRLAAATPFF